MGSGAVARRVHIDWVRGIAVLIMIEAHTLDAWTRTSSRADAIYGWLSMLGGFAAPLFLFLAGLSLALAAERQVQRGATRRQAAEAVVKRGAEIFILAFLFRLQAFVVSPGSWAVTIFRVDILNVLGPSLAVAGILWGVAYSRLGAMLLGAGAALAIAMITPIVRIAEWVTVLPIWFQWYLRPFAEQTTFTLLPWSGFVFAGMASGVMTGAAVTTRAERRLALFGFLAGVGLVWLGFATASLPSIYRVSSFWTSSPTYFAIRVGAMLIFLPAAWALAQWAGSHRVLQPLGLLGRNSLFIYWIHVELVYGYATWAIHRRLPLWGTAIAFVLFTILMFRAIVWRDYVAERWRRRSAKPIPVVVAG